MSVFLQGEIEKLKKMMASPGGHVEESTEKAVRAVHDHYVELAREVIDSDPGTDQMEASLYINALCTAALSPPTE